MVCGLYTDVTKITVSTYTNMTHKKRKKLSLLSSENVLKRDRQAIHQLAVMIVDLNADSNSFSRLISILGGDIS